MTRVSFRLVHAAAFHLRDRLNETLTIPSTPPTLACPALADETESYLCLKHVTKWERGTWGSWGAHACYLLLGAYLQLRDPAPPRLRCRVGGSSREKKIGTGVEFITGSLTISVGRLSSSKFLHSVACVRRWTPSAARWNKCANASFF